MCREVFEGAINAAYGNTVTRNRQFGSGMKSLISYDFFVFAKKRGYLPGDSQEIRRRHAARHLGVQEVVKYFESLLALKIFWNSAHDLKHLPLV